MTLLFLILIILVSVALTFIVLIQNPKGGGLSGSIAGFSNQFMGVKQTTDVLEKGTWVFCGIIAVLSLFSTFFLTNSATGKPDETNKIINTAPVNNQPATNNNTTTFPVNPGTQQPEGQK